MEFTIYRDLASLAFVRCTTPIPGTRYFAEGVGFSVARAIAKCRSERIEASYQLRHPLRSQIFGIAAHPEAGPSSENAWNESLETLILMRMRHDPVLLGFGFNFFGSKMLIGRVNDRFVAIALFCHRNVPTATQAVGKNPLWALLKAWTEVRNLKLYNPSPAILPNYTKANRILSAEQLSRITTVLSSKPNFVDTDALQRFQSKVESHYITFFT